MSFLPADASMKTIPEWNGSMRKSQAKLPRWLRHSKGLVTLYLDGIVCKSISSDVKQSLLGIEENNELERRRNWTSIDQMAPSYNNTSHDPSSLDRLQPDQLWRILPRSLQAMSWLITPSQYEAANARKRREALAEMVVYIQMSEQRIQVVRSRQ